MLIHHQDMLPSTEVFQESLSIPVPQVMFVVVVLEFSTKIPFLPGMVFSCRATPVPHPQIQKVAWNLGRFLPDYVMVCSTDHRDGCGVVTFSCFADVEAIPVYFVLSALLQAVFILLDLLS